jgi:hypothetical protein
MSAPLSCQNMPVVCRLLKSFMHHDQPIAVSFLDRRRDRENLEQGGNDDHRRRRIRMTSDTAPSARPKVSGNLDIPRFPSVLVISWISFSACSWRGPINRSSTGPADRIHVLAKLCMILLSPKSAPIKAYDVTSNALQQGEAHRRSCCHVIHLHRQHS